MKQISDAEKTIIAARLRPSKVKDDLEQALIALANATDSAGLKIILYRPSQGYSIASLREQTFAFLKNADPEAHYITLGVDRSPAAEAAYWRNLALLAHATSKAIEQEMISNGV